MKIGRHIARGGATVVIPVLVFKNRGYTSTQIDDLLIRLANDGVSYQIIDIRGNDLRTSASDAAVITLLNNICEIWEDE